MILTTPAASQNKAFPLAGTLNRLPLSESHIKHRNSPSSPVGRNPLIKLNCAEMEELANSLIRFNSDEVPESGNSLIYSKSTVGVNRANSLILSKTSVRGSREIQDEQQPGSPEHYRYSGLAVIRNGCNNENQQVTGKEKGSAENTTLEMVPFLLHEENQRSPALDDSKARIRASEQNQHLAEQHIRTCEIFVGHRVTVSKPVQPFGSMPRLSSSRRSNLLIQPDLLSSPSSFIAVARRSDNSLSSLSCTTWRSLLSIVDIVNSCGLVCTEVDNVLHCMTYSKAKPRSAGTLTGPLTTNDSQRIEAAMLNHTPTRFKFLFLAVCRSDLNATPHRESVTAHSEQDARRSLAGQFVLSFAGRLPEVTHG
ncbi:host cell division inhibitor Icd-like protein [Yersinia pseudotuberculosis]|uniref:host cell division inhibitor Icd-like protein n=1 Tax=Yersinia pseudotuberculosis TaxID=633 RepID=UPI0005DA8692|nr:host cell division inhibitor Icd-like protein [Yersinia pseudotuberculosis]CFV32724.1 Uncharacterised protein [Yersinia pseudotuberculosis]